MFFPIAGIEVHPLIPPVVAFGISFFASMGGISGAFLLLPFQMSFLGYVHPSVSATNQVFNVVAIPSGVYRYWKEGRLVWPLVWSVVLGTLPGVFIGAYARVMYLPNPQHFKLFAAAVLLYLSVKMFLDIRRNAGKSTQPSSPIKQNASQGQQKDSHAQKASEVLQITRSALRFRYYEQEYTVPLWGIFGLSFVVGIVGGLYGIGGGAIIAPFFVTYFGLPIYIVAGATLMGTFVTSIAGVAFYEIMAPYFPEFSVAPDWTLGLLFGLGGALGMYFGARCQKFVPEKVIKYLLAATMLFTAFTYVKNFITS